MVNKKKELTTAQRQAIFINLWSNQIDFENHTLENGLLSSVARKFNCDRSTISRFWRAKLGELTQLEEPMDQILSNPAYFEKETTMRGRKRIYDRKGVKEEIRTLSFRDRGTVRSTAKALGIPRSTIQRMKKEGILKNHSNPLLPTLSEEQKVARVAYCLEEVFPVVNEEDGKYYYKNQFDRIDVDEKWFFLTRDNKRYIIAGNDDEEDSTVTPEDQPTRRCSHKKYITKVMFLCAQARPRFDPHRNSMWDGKLGIWPIGCYSPAQRSSTHRPAGTMVWTNESVTKETYRRYLLEKVVPAIIEKWPRHEWNNRQIILRIQQDGPNSHIPANDAAFGEGLRKMGVQNKILLFTQPANSPDLNINDLGFFRALQSQYERFFPTNSEDIITYVQQAYAEFPKAKINRIWLTLMSVMNKIIEVHGDNNYKIPHLGKERLERLGELPESLPVTEQAKPYLEG